MKKRRQLCSETPITATIEKFSHDGRGIARIEGKTTFIQGSLPQEVVSFQYIRKKRDYDEGKLLSVIEPSTNRVEPRCPHYALCGGCSLQHLASETQIQEKQAQLLDLLARVGRVQPNTILAPLVSDVWHYRNKARLSVRYVEKKQATLIGFRERHNPRYITEINQCPILNARVDAEIDHLRQLLDSFDDPRTIAQIEVSAGDEEIALIFRNLDKLSEADEDKLRHFGTLTNFRIFLQPGGVDSVYLFYPDDGKKLLSYQLPEENIQFEFYPTDFTQVHSGLNRKMVAQALNLMALEPHDQVLDLFCGLGNFSLPMAKYCNKVTGIEGGEAMVVRAQMNAKLNGLSNTDFFCADLEKPNAFSHLFSQKYTKILLDPPRAGAFEVVKNIDKINPQRVVYISCNPATLARDADILVNQWGYRLETAGVMDMFPHTAHVESIAVFEQG